MLYRLYYKLIDEAVTFRWKRFSARSSRVGGGHGVRVSPQNCCCSRGVGTETGAAPSYKVCSEKTLQKPRDNSDGERSGAASNKSAQTVAGWWAGSAVITCVKTTTHGRSRGQTLDFLRGASPGRDKNGNLTPCLFFFSKFIIVLNLMSLLWRLWSEQCIYRKAGLMDSFRLPPHIVLLLQPSKSWSEPRLSELTAQTQTQCCFFKTINCPRINFFFCL